MKEKYRVNFDNISAIVEIEDDIITDTLPLLRKFQGQKFSNLTGWLHKVFGEVTIQKIKE